MPCGQVGNGTFERMPTKTISLICQQQTLSAMSASTLLETREAGMSKKNGLADPTRLRPFDSDDKKDVAGGNRNSKKEVEISSRSTPTSVCSN